MLVFLVTSLASAAQWLVLSADRPVVFIVNGAPHPAAAGKRVEVTLKNFGGQNVHVYNVVGRRVWSGMVDVPKGEKVIGRWENRRFQTRRPGPPSKGKLPPSVKGQIPKKGKGKGKAKRDPLDWVEQDDSHLDEEVLMDDVLLLLAQAGATENAGGAPPPEPETAPPPSAGGQGQLKIVARTTSWADAYVDDQHIEFRGKSTERVLDLGTGAHQVRFVDPFSKKDWYTGTVLVYPDFVVELHFDKAAVPEAINRPEAFSLTE